MFPEADVPVVQLAIDASKPVQYHVDLGAQLAPLMDDNVLIVGSGNVVHNLRALDWNSPDAGYDWALRFNEDAKRIVEQSPGTFSDLAAHDDYRLAVPTADHFLPLAYLAGIAQAWSTTATSIVDGYQMGSLSMAAYRVD
jgi:4,5-DOPA dioxygenase extradiol